MTQVFELPLTKFLEDGSVNLLKSVFGPLMNPMVVCVLLVAACTLVLQFVVPAATDAYFTDSYGNNLQEFERTRAKGLVGLSDYSKDTIANASDHGWADDPAKVAALDLADSRAGLRAKLQDDTVFEDGNRRLWATMADGTRVPTTTIIPGKP